MIKKKPFYAKTCTAGQILNDKECAAGKTYQTVTKCATGQIF